MLDRPPLDVLSPSLDLTSGEWGIRVESYGLETYHDWEPTQGDHYRVLLWPSSTSVSEDCQVLEKFVPKD